MQSIDLSPIQLQGVRVHNLKNVSLAIPRQQLTVVCGVSGSGKSSLAFDTLYAESQRRYIENFSAYARQFLDKIDRPDVDKIEPLPPAIAVRQNATSLSSKSTVATATEIHDHLRLLFSKVGEIICPECQSMVVKETPDSVLKFIQQLPEATRFQIGFDIPDWQEAESREQQLQDLLAVGYTRLVFDGNGTSIQNVLEDQSFLKVERAICIVDRLANDRLSEPRVIESVEAAFDYGNGRCLVLANNEWPIDEIKGQQKNSQHRRVTSLAIDGKQWNLLGLCSRLECSNGCREFIEPRPALFSFNSPLGACPTCTGFGKVSSISFDHLVPDTTKTLREGAIVPWTTPAYRHELEELLDLAFDYDIPVDVPFSELTDQHLDLIYHGVPERNFGGLVGFFAWLQRNKYKMSVSVFLNRWRTYSSCTDCHGARLSEQALAVQVAGQSMADICALSIEDATHFVESLINGDSFGSDQVVSTITDEIQSRLSYLKQVGLGYLTLDRVIRTLSGGEAQRIALTAALGSSLVNMLYVLDEPSAGLHPRDTERVIEAINHLKQLGNTVVVVEHEDEFVLSADHLIEIGPGAGAQGGSIVFEGKPAEILDAAGSVTGEYLKRRQGSSQKEKAVDAVTNSSPPQSGIATEWLKLTSVRKNNIDNIDVRFPLSQLCVVTGVSGSGKSTLVQDVLYPSLCRELGQACDLEYDSQAVEMISGAEVIDEVIFVDQSPIRRSRRSIPATYLNIFDDIRKLFAETADAKVRNYTVSQFSFNSARGGRCDHCQGKGQLEIDMQFLPSVAIQCPECGGSRFQREVLEVKYRSRTIADVLAMTVEEAFTFFRTQHRLLKKLTYLKQVGLDYLPLGQSLDTLSGGEAQRLKLASYLSTSSRRHVCFLVDEPTTGLHASDVQRLLDCFQSLVAVGHSLIVIEHQHDVIRAADYIIDLGPEAGVKGGAVVATGAPSDIASTTASITGEYLRKALNV